VRVEVGDIGALPELVEHCLHDLVLERLAVDVQEELFVIGFTGTRNAVM
jgi:hypothetical protein